MGIKTQKVLRLISKIILILVGVGLVGIAGYYAYKSIAFKPQNVVVTNITDGSATVTWTTSSPMKGIVYVKKDKALLPGPLGIIGSSMAYDDRDVSDAQKACVDAFNKKASETKDSTFSVSGENFDCENVKVTKMGSYYTHSVTMTNLDENSTYNFVVGDGIWSFKESVSTVKTFGVLETVGEPKPIFGRIVSDDGTYSRDGLVYITFRDGSEGKDSIVYSSTTNEDGGWYLDASSVRDVQGNVIDLELTNDTFKLKGIYSNYGVSEEEKYILGYFNGAYPDVVVKKTGQVNSSAFEKLIGYIYAKNEEESYADFKTTTTTTTKPTATTTTSTKTAEEKVSAVCTKCINYVSSADLQKIATEKATTGTSSTLAGLATSIGAGNAAKISSALSSDGNVNFSDIGISENFGNINSLVGNTVTTAADVSNVKVSYTGGSSSATATIKEVNTYYSATTTCTSDGCGGTTTTYDGPGGSVSTTTTAYVCTNGSCNSSNQYCSNNSWQLINDKCGYYTNNSTTNDSDGSSSIVTNTESGSFDCGENNCIVSFGNTTSNLTVAQMKKVLNNYDPDKSGLGVIFASNIDLYKFLKYGADDAENAISNYAPLREVAIVELNALEAKVAGTQATNSPQITDKIQVLCDALGGTTDRKQAPRDCTIPETQNLNPLKPSKVEAADSSTDSYALYMPEYGMYSFQLGDYTMSSSVSDGKTIYLFYIEANGADGFQMPIDVDNPTSSEDIVLSSASYQITYKQESTAQQYEIKKGINIISFNFVPVSTDTGAYTAKDVISQASTNGVEVQYISTFDGGRWNNGYSCSSGTCTGNNFTIVPGKGYLIYATQSGTVTIPGYNLTSSVPVAFSVGWNLVGVHGYTTAYTARSFIDSINTIEGLTANNVSWWPTSKSKYEGVEVDNGTQYGLDFSMSPNNGYFVRISKFAPTDTKCKSLIWNAGGSLNGTCGNTK